MPTSKTTIVVAVLLVITGLLAVQFNPTPEMHRAKIRQSLGDRSPLMRLLGIGSITAFLSNYHSIGVASYTKAGDKTLSIGAFGQVHVLDPRDGKGD